ncbi:TIGR04282 family arsenosugar biosynthesis glycosyltransferase [Aliivibrio logei]|uniref:Glycosyltransferase n=1 Tax=Aliivibrio logei TaxID=688 RepID=A0A1B9P0I0_ALILO|nr:TIGR04282 family arsenosugar biosynthesis glycosyltransferase [Aliivibrio logei]OCH21877.1 hypothetical protein A6E04_08430 [Aliivibrio logei]
MNETKIIIMAKTPVAGMAKTRLIPSIGMENSGRLAKMLFRHTINEAISSDIGPIELCVTPSLNSSCWKLFSIPPTVKWSLQREGNLGERLTSVSRKATHDYSTYIIIGTDCPALTRDILQSAAHSLHNSDSCLVPVSDGGYSLLGLTKHHDSLFNHIPWSTNQVYALTEQRIKSLNWSVTKLKELHDIDIIDDLKWLPKSWGFN